MRRSACLAAALAVLVALPALAQGITGTVAAVSPPLSSVQTNSSGCTPLNPCAVATPNLGGATLPAPQAPPQPNFPGSSEAPALADTATPGRPAAAQADCPAPGARGGFGRGQGRGFSAGRGGEGRGAFAGRGRGGRGLPANCLPAGRGNPTNPAPR